MKPIFYSVDPFQKYDEDNVMELFFRYNHKGYMRYEIWGIFKNTDQAIMKLDYLVMGNLRYYPQNGDVIDKNVTFEIRILTDKIPKNHNIIMKTEDVLGNIYWYKMKFTRKYDVYSITYLKEIRYK